MRKGSSVENVATDAKLTVPEAARRLGIPGGEVYRLVFRGELLGVPERDGAVYISEDAVEIYITKRRPEQSSSP